MSDSEKKDSAGKGTGSENSSLGIVFAIVGVALMLTLDTWAIGLPFVIVGITFFATAFTKRHRADESSPH